MKASIQNSFLPLKLLFRCTGRFILKRQLDFLTHIERTCKRIARIRNVTREYERNKSSHSENYDAIRIIIMTVYSDMERDICTSSYKIIYAELFSKIYWKLFK